MWQKFLTQLITALVAAISEKIVTPLYQMMKEGIELAKRKKKGEQTAQEVKDANNDQDIIDAANKLP